MKAVAGEVYRFSGSFATHRCSGRIELSFFDSEGRPLEGFEGEIPPSYEGGQRLANYAEVVVSGRAPKRAATLSVTVYKGATSIGADSFLFFTLMSLVRGHSGADEGPVTFLPALTVEIFAGATHDAHLLLPVWPSFLAQDDGANIALVDQASGARIERSNFRLANEDRLKIEVYGLEGAVIVARVIHTPSNRRTIKVAIWVDGVIASVTSLSGVAEAEIVRCVLPASACDGRPHLFQVRDDLNGDLLGQFVDLGPDILTPWSALQRYSGWPLPIERAPAMESRYRALTRSLHELAASAPLTDGKDGHELGMRLRRLALCHELVVQGFERKRTVWPTLEFTSVSAPRVSIVIPVHNKFDVTYNCLAALILAHNDVGFDVIVVDDGSTDETLDLPDIVKNVTYVRNETALGFVGACNRGAQAARGEFIVFLNNDTEPTEGWLDELVFAFDAFDGVGLAGSKLLYGDGRLQEAGGIVWETGDPWNYGRGDNPRAPQYSYTREVDYLSGASLMIPRTLWEELGGFSQEFAPAYFEDTDLAFKVKAAGKRVVFAPMSIVYHFEGLSNGTDTSTTTGLKRFQEINRPKFKRKWQALFRGNGKVGVDVHLAKDRGVTRRVLMFDIDTPRIDNDAGSYAEIQEIRLLQSLGFKVTFVPTNLAYLGRHTQLLQRMGVEVIYAPHVPSLEAFIASRIAEFDLVFITRYQVADRVTDLVRAQHSNVPIVCNVADLHFLRGLREAALGTPDAERLDQLARERDHELNTLAKVDLILTYSPIEQSVISSHYLGSKKVALLPWVVDTSPKIPAFAERQGIAFLGGFGHPPNVSAVEFFVSEVMPLLRNRLPNIPFRIYGSSIPASLRELAAEDVIFEGYVANVEDVFNRCRVFVAPLLYGAGMKGKVLDCLAAGVPSVLSPAAAEAVALTNGSEAFVADTAIRWAEAVASLYHDEPVWTAMSKAALALARREYSFARGRDVMSAALEKVGLYVEQDRSAVCVNHARPPAPASSSFGPPPRQKVRPKSSVAIIPKRP